VIYLDTHAVVWLYAGELERFSADVLDQIESNPVLISPAVQLELQYLLEIERIKVPPTLIIESLNCSIGLNVCLANFLSIITEAMLMSWTRDPFDRMIAAHASTQNAVLISKDKTIRANYSKAIW